jgi:tRNA dimethylallyltransferase
MRQKVVVTLQQTGHESLDPPIVVVIVGPTAVGKSDLAMALAQHFGGEIVSADSRQIYRYLDVGTAKPTIGDRLLVPHHLVDIVAPDQEFTLAAFQEHAMRAIAGALERGRLPVLIGGTGLYIRAVVTGLRIPRVAPNHALRATLEKRAAEDGAAALHDDLAALDAAAAARIDARNVRRVVRALEVCLTSGQAMSALQGAQAPSYRFVMIGLTCAREVLFQRIDERIKRQVKNGLVEETQRAMSMGYAFTLPAMSGLGHRQISLNLRGEITIDEAIEMDKRDTRRYARQQYNWFRPNDPAIQWLDIDGLVGDSLVQEAVRIVAGRMS